MSILYSYDGSFDGMLCCIFESFEKKEMPISIVPHDKIENTFWEERYIQADLTKSQRVFSSISRKISLLAEDLVRKSFLTCLPDKELHILKFLQLGYQVGRKVMDMLTDDRVNILLTAVNHLGREAHLLCGFVRFTVFDDSMVSIIEPKNYVLPIIAPHFCDRYNNENFLIFDKTHKMAVVYQHGKLSFLNVEQLELPKENANESEYKRLWKQFYDTIAIKERYNPRCRMSHMPKRYWGNMTEFNE